MENTRSFRKFKKEPMIVSLVFLALSLAAFIFVYGRVLENEKSATEAEAVWRMEASRREEIVSLDRLLQDLAPERAELASHFAQGSNAVPFLDALEKMGTQVSVKPEIAFVDITKDKSGLLVDIRTSGTFEAVYKYLLLLENSPYELEFLVVDLGKQGDQNADWRGNFKIKLLSFLP
jgi:hypothetical protein